MCFNEPISSFKSYKEHFKYIYLEMSSVCEYPTIHTFTEAKVWIAFLYSKLVKGWHKATQLATNVYNFVRFLCYCSTNRFFGCLSYSATYLKFPLRIMHCLPSSMHLISAMRHSLRMLPFFASNFWSYDTNLSHNFCASKAASLLGIIVILRKVLYW